LSLSTLNFCKSPLFPLPFQNSNISSVLDYHYKTWIPIFSCLLTVSGWWAWNLFLSAAYSNTPGVYTARDAFIHHFDLTWWAVLVIVIMACVALELIIDVVRRWWWAGPIDIWQEVEMERRNKNKRGRDEEDEGDEDEEEDGEIRV
jgi:phospholipid-translocating ATPase